ncbi:MAG: hypothetical protein JWM11_7568 [Planctomycetaceae bacterium]|nr:hypothetical protein [Planctomycetaceae bacterium]
MSQQRVDQLFCTHCTYRSSALHRREGAAGDKVFDESARAGSVPREKSHEVFQRFSSNLVFHVPGDMPSIEMVKHTAHTLPWRRLVYLPSVAGNRMLAHVCFRQTDATGRPGSSFSHVLIQDLKEFPNPWSAIDCLRLWGSKKWVLEDRLELRHDLPCLGELKEFDPGLISPINDQLLISFLKAPAGYEFLDRGVIIPKRWQMVAPQDRQKLLASLLQAVLNLDLARRESLLIVAEPSVAALLFYGIFRLLPRSAFTEQLSFSTYQSHRDRLVTTLAATCFHEPLTTDLDDEWYSSRARGAAFNTFKTDRQTPAKKTGRFASDIVARLIAGGPAAVDSLLSICSRLGIGTGDGLEGLSAIDGHVAALLNPQSKDDLVNLERSLPRDPGLRAFLQTRLAQSLGLDAATPQWTRLLAAPAYSLFVCKLLSESGAVENAALLNSIVQQLLTRWPQSGADELLSDKDLPKKCKVDFVVRCAESTGILPGNTQALFFTVGAVCYRDKILEDVLSRLNGVRLKQLVLKTFEVNPSEACFCDLLRKLAPLTGSQDHEQAFRQLFQRLPVRVTSPEQQRQILNAALSDKVVRDQVKTWPADAAISAHLLEVLNTLDESPRQLEQRIAVLEDLKGFLSGSQERVDAWRTLAKQLTVLQELNAEPTGILQRMLGQDRVREQDEAAKELAFAAKRAFPAALPEQADEFAAQVTGLVIDFLGDDALPMQFQDRAKEVCINDVWPVRSSRSGMLVGLATTAVMLALCTFLGFQWLESRRSTRANDNLATANTELQTEKPEPAVTPAKKSDIEQPDAEKIAVDDKVDVKKLEVEQAEAEKLKLARRKQQDLETAQAEAAKREAEKKEANEKLAARRIAAAEKLAAKKMAAAEKRKKTELEPEEGTAPAGPPAAKTMTKPDAMPPTDAKVAATRPPGPMKEPKKPKPVSTIWPATYVLPEVTNMEPKPPLRLRPWPGLKETKLTLIGIAELNRYLSKPTDSSLKELRLHLESRKPTDDETVPTIRVFKISWTEYETRKSGTVHPIPKAEDLLCEFNIQADGLYFQWANQTNLTSENRALQEMLRLCCLQVESDGQPYEINLIAAPKLPAADMYHGVDSSAGNPAVAPFIDDPAIKKRAVFDFNSGLKGAEAFEWLVTRGNIVSQDGDRSLSARAFRLTPDDAVKAKSNLGFSIEMEDPILLKEWQKHKFSCDLVQFNQLNLTVTNDANGPHLRLTIGVVLDLLEEQIRTRLDHLDKLLELPNSVKSLQGRISTFDGDPFAPAGTGYKLFDVVEKIEQLAKELEAWVEAAPDAKPGTKRKPFEDYGLKITMKTTMETADLEKLKVYLKDVWSLCEKCNGAKTHLNSQFKFAKNKEGELDLAAISRMKQFYKLEVYELSRRIEGRWVPIVLKEDD